MTSLTCLGGKILSIWNSVSIKNEGKIKTFSHCPSERLYQFILQITAFQHRWLGGWWSLLIELNYIEGEPSLWEENTGFRLVCCNWVIFINSIDIQIPLDYLCDNDNNKNNKSWHSSYYYYVPSPLHEFSLNFQNLMTVGKFTLIL